MKRAHSSSSSSSSYSSNNRFLCGRVCAVYDTFRIIHTLKCHRNCCRVQFIISRLNFPRIPLKDAAYLLLKIVTQYFSICMRLMGNDICSCDAIDSSSCLQQQKREIQPSPCDDCLSLNFK